jgi:broad specificity phosphatase PhoE
MNDHGRSEARRLAETLANEQIDAFIASDLGRAWETAQMVAEPHDCDVLEDPRFREIRFGAWEGWTWEQVKREDAQTYARWHANPLETAPAGGETLNETAERLESALADLRQRPEGERIAVIAHGGALSIVACLILGLSPAKRWQFTLKTTSVSEVRLCAEGAILYRWNDRHHLDGLAG